MGTTFSGTRDPRGRSLFERGAQVPVGGGHQAHIYFDGARAAQTFELAFLQNAQQLTWVTGGTSPISSRNNVPLSASSNFPACWW